MFGYIEMNVLPMFRKFIPVQSTGGGIKYKEEGWGGGILEVCSTFVVDEK
jgi:hypothetical protein